MILDSKRADSMVEARKECSGGMSSGRMKTLTGLRSLSSIDNHLGIIPPLLIIISLLTTTSQRGICILYYIFKK